MGIIKNFYEKVTKSYKFFKKKSQKILSFSRNNLFNFYYRTEPETGELVEKTKAFELIM